MQFEYIPHEREEEVLLSLKLMLWLCQDGAGFNILASKQHSKTVLGSNPPAEDKFPYND